MRADDRPPTDSRGNEVAAWSIHVEYFPLTDEIKTWWKQEAGPYHKAKSVVETYGVVDLEDVIAHFQRRVRILGARRLF